jgi:hypothetical protein
MKEIERDGEGENVEILFLFCSTQSKVAGTNKNCGEKEEKYVPKICV